MAATNPLVLLHAFPVDRRLWEDVVPGLREAGIDPIVPDLRGFGDNRGDLPSVPNLDVLADDVAELIKNAGAPAVVAGVSMGGYVAMNLARRYPELVSGLVFVDTKAGQDAEAMIEGRHAFANQVDAQGSDWVADVMIPNLLSESTRQHLPGVEARVREQIADCPPVTISWIQRAMAARPDSLPVLEDFAGPELVIGGENDAMSPPSEALLMAQAAREATLVEVPDAGHLTPIEAPSIVAKAISEWLAERFE